jgi:hypothetical protein
MPTIKRLNPEPERNAPCPCGSGKKYKHCHLKVTTYSFRVKLIKHILIEVNKELMGDSGTESFSREQWIEAINNFTKKNDGENIWHFAMNRLSAFRYDKGKWMLKLSEMK